MSQFVLGSPLKLHPLAVLFATTAGVFADAAPHLPKTDETSEVANGPPSGEGLVLDGTES